MKKLLAVFLAVVLITSMLVPCVAFAVTDYSYIKVKLSSMGSPSTVQFQVKGAYRISEAAAVDLYPGITYTMKAADSGAGMTLSYNSGVGTVNIALPATVTFAQYYNGSATNFLYINNPNYGWKYYDGDMTFTRLSGSNYSYLQLVNRVYLETYLYGVVTWEMSNSWPTEALKAQAVASRTYAMRFLRNPPSSAYNIVDTSANQVYKGYPIIDGAVQQRVIDSVNATRYKAVTSGSATDPSLVDGVFSASNGGQVRATGSTTYTVMKDDPYDMRNSASPSFRYILPKTTNLTGLGTTDKAKVDTLYGLMKTKLVALLKSQKGITCTEANIAIKGVKSVALAALRPNLPAGSREFTRLDVVTTIATSGLTTNYSGDMAVQLAYMNSTGSSIGELRSKFASYYSLLNSSSLWNLYLTSDTNFIYVTARGYGHGRGLSQRGAQQMANEGKAYTDILNFYYNFATKGTALTAFATTKKALTQIPGRGTSAVYGKIINVASYANLRAAANTSATAIGQIKLGTTVEITQTLTGWYKVLYAQAGMVGYISSNYVQSASAPTPVPSATATLAPSATPTPTPAPTPVPNPLGKAAAAINLRSKASATASIVCLIPKGATVSILDRSAAAGWYKLRYGAYTGYGMSQYVSVVGYTSVPTRTPTATPTATPAPTSTSVTLKTVTGTANVTDYLSLRASASTTATVLVKIPRNGAMTVNQVSTNASWLKVTYSGKTGYVMARYVIIAGNSAYRAGTITTALLNVRASASTTGSILGTLKSGNTVVIISTVTSGGKTWYKILYGSGAAYIDSTYCRKMTT